MTDFTVQDNYLNDVDFHKLTQWFSPLVSTSKSKNRNGGGIPWCLVQHITGISADCPDIYDYYWLHLFYEDNDVRSLGFGELIPLLFKIGITPSNKEKLIRVKANLYTVTPTIIEHGYHMDYEVPSTTSVFYVNTNDGYTKFRDGPVIDSVANRLLTFPTLTEHTSSSCTNAPYRININLNYKV